MKFSIHAIAATAAMVALCQCSSSSTTSIRNADVIVSVKDQKMGIYRAGSLVASYKVSTSKFGIGDRPGSNYTPLGKHEVVAKIGHGLPSGAVLKSRQWNGEVLRPNAPGRDPIVSRILWLSGRESSNRNAYQRFIYIHGTTEEFRLGTPASYGCVRMAARDVINVFNSVPIGASVVITREGLPQREAGIEPAKPVQIPPLTPDSKPGDPPILISAPQLARQQPAVERTPGAGPAPVLITKAAKPAATSPARATSSPPVPVSQATATPAPAKRRFFGLMGGGSSAPVAAPAVAQKSTAPAPATAPVATTPAPTKRRFFGLMGGGSSEPTPAPVPAQAPASSNMAGPPKATKPTKPVATQTTTKGTSPAKKRPTKKVANDSSGAASPAKRSIHGHRASQSA